MHIISATRLLKLKPVAQAVVPARTTPINLLEFFQNNPRIFFARGYLESDPDELNGLLWQTVQSAPQRSYAAYALKQKFQKKKPLLSDIFRELPVNYFSTPGDIADLIEAQLEASEAEFLARWNGRGILQENNRENLFFVKNEGEIFGIGVTLHLGVKNTWGVEAFSLARHPEYYLPPYSRILCPIQDP